MAVDLSDDQYVASLQREVTPMGSTPPADVSDGGNVNYVGYLTDAFWEARLDGFFPGYVCDEDGLITPVETGTSDLDRRYVALIVLYAGIRVLRNQILNTNTGFRAKAGPVEFEQQNSATMLAAMLAQLSATKTRIIDELDELAVTQTLVLDALSTRLFEASSYWGSIELSG